MLVNSPKLHVFSVFITLLNLISAVSGKEGGILVKDAKELQNELIEVKPGATIKLAPGHYGNGFRFEGLSGTESMPITIMGEDEENPPVFEGGSYAIHFVGCSYITLRHIRVTGCKGNGINADDGGQFDSPSKGMVFENLEIENIGPKGNRDALKLSGLDQFKILKCRFSGWGGSAIDMVGCHDGIIDRCRFVGKKDYSQSSGVQTKGGSENIFIRRSFFKNAGQRAVNLGGSTGRQFFRPKLRDYEAKSIVVEGNHFVGGMSPIVYTTSIGCKVRRNTIIKPDKWVLRILQEQPLADFKACQHGGFESNLVVFDKQVRTFVNVGSNTRPETFLFRNNAWFNIDGNRQPSLPSREEGGIYQIDPILENADNPDLKVKSTNPLILGVGSHSFLTENSKSISLQGKDRKATELNQYGIAAGYLNDKGIENDPNVILFSDFDSKRWNQQWSGGNRETVSLIEGDNKSKFEFFQNKALSIKVVEGQHYGASLAYPFSQKIGHEPEEIYFRYYLRLGDDWDPQRGGKLPGIAGTYGRAGWGGRKSDGRNGWSARGLFLGQKNGKTPIGFYCYHAKMKGIYGEHWVWDIDQLGYLENNRWYCIEQQVKLNAPGENDGILRGWVDGMLAFEKMDVHFRDTPELKIENVWINLYHGGSWTPSSDDHIFIDNIVIAKDYIGPSSNTADQKVPDEL